MNTLCKQDYRLQVSIGSCTFAKKNILKKYSSDSTQVILRSFSLDGLFGVRNVGMQYCGRKFSLFYF